MSLIELRNLSFSYRTASGETVPVLKNLNLKIEAGELVAIQGPSGSGKSTLLYVIGGLLSRYEGSVEVMGHALKDLGDEDLAILRNQSIGFVFQQFHLLPKANVLENVLLPSLYPAERPRRMDADRRARVLIDRVGLTGREDHVPNQLSGGQQQRVAIARALLNDTELILADEPTGSLDSKASGQIMDLLKAANHAGKTVVIITHDAEVAAQCGRLVHFRDGEIREAVGSGVTAAGSSTAMVVAGPASPPVVIRTRAGRLAALVGAWPGYARLARTLLPVAVRSLRQNRSRTVLTMIGIVIGVAAVLSMMTLGNFTKTRILDSYAEMGVDTVMVHGYPNWQLRATDQTSVVFQSFDWARDLHPLRRVFSDITALSPMLSSGNNRISYGGKVVDSDVRAFGVSEDGLRLANRTVALGTDFSPFHVRYRSAVCIVGFEIFERLFQNVSPIGQIITVSQQDTSFGCRVIGVLAAQSSNKEWNKPNLAVYVPYTFFQGVTEPWNARIREILLRMRAGVDPELAGRKIKAFFGMKYGRSARFDVGADTVLIAQMTKFLNLFTVLLAAIAFVSLAVGGVGITNMMLVSVNERFKEIGIRKAFGATRLSVRTQYLIESILICGLAGLLGLALGFVLYEGAIYGASQLMPKVEFTWTLDGWALGLSLASTLAVGILSGLTPALRAEKLQVIEALRSE